MSRKHLDCYVNEFTSHHNVPEADSEDRMERLVLNMEGKPLRYEELIADNGLDSMAGPSFEGVICWGTARSNVYGVGDPSGTSTEAASNGNYAVVPKPQMDQMRSAALSASMIS